MKNKLKILSIILMAVILIPDIAFASWWNPLSWFNKVVPVSEVHVADKTKELTSEEKIKDILYEEFLKDQANKVKKISPTVNKKEVKNTQNRPVTNNAPTIQQIAVSQDSTSTPTVIQHTTVLIPENNDKQCDNLKAEFYDFETKWKQIDPFNENSVISILRNDLLDDFGLNSSVSNGSDFDAGYRKFLSEKGGYYSKIENLRLNVLDLSVTSFGKTELENIKVKANKGLDLYKDAFDSTLLGYSFMSSDKYVWVMGIKIMPQQNFDDSKSNVLQGSEKRKNALNYFYSANGDYTKIKNYYNDSINKLGCKY